MVSVNVTITVPVPVTVVTPVAALMVAGPETDQFLVTGTEYVGELILGVSATLLPVDQHTEF
jgi:hypothetical protein